MNAVPQNPSLLDVQDLSIFFESAEGIRKTVVDHVSFSLTPSQTLGLVGESGSGKTSIALALLRLVKPPAVIAGGRIVFNGTDLLRLPADRMRPYRGRRIAMVFQEPLAAMDPLSTIRTHLAEGILCHFHSSRRQAEAKAIGLLGEVGLEDPPRILNSYPHQLSGGERQRVAVALALSGDPELLLADEPTSALDPVLQAHIVALLQRVADRRKISILLISHDLPLVSSLADRIVVLRSGRIVESLDRETLFQGARHPYTRELVNAARRVGWLCWS